MGIPLKFGHNTVTIAKTSPWQNTFKTDQN
jgi:hypothetical protein